MNAQAEHAKLPSHLHFKSFKGNHLRRHILKRLVCGIMIAFEGIVRLRGTWLSPALLWNTLTMGLEQKRPGAIQAGMMPARNRKSSDEGSGRYHLLSPKPSRRPFPISEGV